MRACLRVCLCQRYVQNDRIAKGKGARQTRAVDQPPDNIDGHVTSPIHSTVTQRCQ